MDETLIPANYWKLQEPKLDRKALLSDLKAEEVIQGLGLSNGGQTIQFKWS